MTSDSLRILVVEDEAAMREVLEMRLADRGFEVRLAEDATTAERLAQETAPHLVISDVALPDSSGLELLEKLRAGDPGRPVLLITAYGTVDSAVEAMKLGALDFLTKPLDYDKLDAALESARRMIARRTDSRRLDERLDEDAGLGFLIGTSKPMRAVYELLETIASSDASAIISGESGTGKELAARTIHALSQRASGPFVPVNTAAIAEGITESELFGHEKGAFTGASRSRAGYFELADRGTLFLDEIGEMPAPVQSKILRAVEDGKIRRLGGTKETAVDIRLLAATNRDPQKAIEDGRLREDLFYRLSVFTVEMPTLRARPSDVPLLAQYFVRLCNGKHKASVEGISAEALEILTGYDWPGNVRELRNAIERSVIVTRRGWIETVHLPPFLRHTDRTEPTQHPEIRLPADSTVAEAEKILILETLKKTGNNKTQAAKRLGLDVRTIRYKLKAWADRP